MSSAEFVEQILAASLEDPFIGGVISSCNSTVGAGAAFAPGGINRLGEETMVSILMSGVSLGDRHARLAFTSSDVTSVVVVARVVAVVTGGRRSSSGFSCLSGPGGYIRIQCLFRFHRTFIRSVQAHTRAREIVIPIQRHFQLVW